MPTLSLRALLSRLLLLGLLLLASGASRAVDWAVVIVSSERSAAYAEAAEALLSELERNGTTRTEVLQITAPELAATSPLSPKLFVALGAEAAYALARAAPRAPVLCTLLPRSTFERILRETGRRASSHFSALYLDQPLARQLELIRLAQPSARRIAIVWGPESLSQAQAMRALASARGLELVEASVANQEPLFPSFKKVLADADVLLALADPYVYNSSSLQNILLTSIREKIPLVAFSPAYVRAGALAALYSTPAAIGQQAGSIARSVILGKGLLATPVYPLEFEVSVNAHVAHALGLTLDADNLHTRLHQRETTP